MKFLKIAVAAVLALAGGTAYAFHDGGVASCEGCHVMHNATDGKSVTVKSGVRNNQTNSYLLQGTDQSSTCLICHATSVAGQAFMASNPSPATAPSQYTPGGDFGWLAGTLSVRKGHNVVAADYAAQGFVADTAMPIAPGGTFAGGSGKAAFACSNCHDPHGRYRLVGDAGATGAVTVVLPSDTANVKPIVASGSYGVVSVGGTIGNVPNANFAVGVYRILGGANYAPASNTAFPFSANPPSAVAPSNYNRADTQASEVRVAYGQGMSEWCQNCHTNIHFGAANYVTGGPGQRHPSSNGAHLTAAIAGIYNTYVSSGAFSASAKEYNALVPFESGTTNLATLAAGAATVDNTNNPAIFTASGTSNVMCLSCHRAHASGFDSITRWNNSSSATGAGFLADATGFTSVPGLNNTTQIQAAYYGRQVGSQGTDIRPFQRSLCNKCHGKD
jgi:hypothetical protein